jgi:hypothetical protein
MMKPTTVAPRHPAGPVSAREDRVMQGVEIQLAQQMAAGNQRNGNSSRVTASRWAGGICSPIQQAQALRVDRLFAVTVSCESDELARINHLLDCARQDGVSSQVTNPCRKNNHKYYASHRDRRGHVISRAEVLLRLSIVATQRVGGPDGSLHSDRSLLRKDFFNRYKKGHSFE